ncbi:MAG TPA: response regulator [Methylomirabilota bacterium]
MKAYPLIAVVDDDASVRKALSRLLTAYGLGVTTFACGQDFIDSIARRRPDCLILDMDMPGMTGADVQRALTGCGARVPTIIIAGRDDPDTEARCLAAGAAAYLRKPIDERVLLDAVTTALPSA